MSRRLAAALSAVLTLVVLVLFGGTAHAGNGFAMAVDVQNSHQTIVGEQDGFCRWQVTSDITLVNLTNTPLTIDNVDDVVTWQAAADSTDSGVQPDVDVLNDAGLRAGVQMAPRETRRFEGAVVEFMIPCRATYGDLMVRVTTAMGTSSGDAPFLVNGTPVPITAVGALGLTAVLAGAFVVFQRRRHVAAANV